MYKLFSISFLCLFFSIGAKQTFYSTFMPEHLNDNKRIFFVCSYGGCGSTALTNFLGRYGTAVHVHSRRPVEEISFVSIEWFTNQILPREYLNKIKFIYLFRNPTEAQISRWRNDAFRAMQVPNYGSVPSINDYVKNGVDLLRYEDFFNNYVNKRINKNYQIIAINYHKMWDNLPQILDVLGLPRLGANHFPRKVEGKSSYVKNLEPWVVDGLNKINKPLINKINGMPAVTVLGPYS